MSRQVHMAGSEKSQRIDGYNAHNSKVQHLTPKTGGGSRQINLPSPSGGSRPRHRYFQAGENTSTFSKSTHRRWALTRACIWQANPTARYRYTKYRINEGSLWISSNTRELVHRNLGNWPGQYVTQNQKPKIGKDKFEFLKILKIISREKIYLLCDKIINYFGT